MRWLLYIAMAGSLAVGAALAASSIDPDYKYAWCENVGWTNWRDANGGDEGVEAAETCLSGFIWAENAGWINVGDGAPTDGTYYANVDGSDFGVNIDTNGDLFGLAWSENIGWVNFGTRDKGDERAGVDCDEGRLYGYVWGENVGWINLDHATHYIAGDFGEACAQPFGDHDGDGDVDLDDYGVFEDCLNGPDSWPNPTFPTTPQDCLDWFNADTDWDVDLADFAQFQSSFTGGS